jgi:hypothetical protein
MGALHRHDPLLTTASQARHAPRAVSPMNANGGAVPLFADGIAYDPSSPGSWLLTPSSLPNQITHRQIDDLIAAAIEHSFERP